MVENNNNTFIPQPATPESKSGSNNYAEKFNPDKFVPYTPKIPNRVYVPTDSYFGTSSGIQYGQSKYDVDMPIDYGTENTIDADRSERQSFFAALGNGIVSRGISIVPKITEGFGFVSGSVPAAAAGDINKMTKNDIVKESEAVDESLRELFPVYASSEYSGGNLLAKFASRKFWFDDAFDGVAFMASAAIPAGMIGKAFKVLGVTAEAMNGIVAANKIGQKIIQSAPIAVSTIYNTAAEAGFEARDTQKTVYNELIRQGFSHKDAKLRADNAALHTFGANSLILALPNAIESNFFLGGFKKGAKSIRRSVIEAAAKGSKEPVINIGREVAKKAILGIATEGIWEEGIQNGIQQWEKRAAETGAYDNKNWIESLGTQASGTFDEYIKGFSTDEGITSMVLGSIIGGLMGGAFTYSDKRSEKKEAEAFSKYWSKYENDILNRNDELFKSRLANPVNKKTGDVNINDLARETFRDRFDRAAFTEESAAMAKDDKFHHLYNQKMNTARFIYSYLSDHNFEDTDLAFEYAMNRLDRLAEENGEEIDKESLSQIKEEAKKVKELYDELEADRSIIDSFTEDQKRVNFGKVVNKTILYEKLKQQYLEEIRGELDEKHSSAIDEMINDSQKRINSLRNKSIRDELFKNYQDSENIINERFENAKEVSILQKEIETQKENETNKQLTEEELEDRKKKLKKLFYELRESEIIHGERVDDGFDIAVDSEEGISEKRKADLGIVNSARFMKGMRFEKRKAVEEAYAKYKNGEVPISHVISTLTDYTNEASPILSDDIKLLKSLLGEARAISNTVDEQKFSSYKDIYLHNLNIVGEEKARESAGLSEEDVKEAAIADDAKKSISVINAILNANKDYYKKNLTDKELDENVTPGRLHEIAMRRFIDETVSPAINAFKSSPETYSNVSEANNALFAIEAAEEAYNSDSRRNIMDTESGRALKAEIEEMKAQIKAMLSAAIKNKGNKQAADKTFNRTYGTVGAYAFKIDSILTALKKYFGVNDVDSIFEAMESSDMDPIYIDLFIKKIKNLPEAQRDEIIGLLKKEYESRKKALADEFLSIMKGNMSEDAWAVLGKSLTSHIQKYEQDPVGYLKHILSQVGVENEETDKETPFEVYSSTGSFYAFIDKLASIKTTDESGLKKIDVPALIDIAEQQSAIESLFNAIERLESKEYNRDSILKNERDLYNKKEGVSPSRQQRAAINDLLLWFFTEPKVFDVDAEIKRLTELYGESPNHENTAKRRQNDTLYAFSYLRGIAGSGKTTVVLKRFISSIGIDLNSVVAFGNNDSATESINKSLGTKSNINSTTFSRKDISDDTKLVVIDEVGAIEEKTFKSIVAIINEVNTERVKAGKEQVRVLLMGDPSQITKGLSRKPYLESIRSNAQTMRQITPLTIAFRSNITDIVDFQTIFMNNRNYVRGIQAKASAPIGTLAEGVHVSQSRKDLEDQILIHKDNGKSKVIIVGEEDDVSRYEHLKSAVPGIEILSIFDVQGRTFDEVYIDIDLSKYEGKDGNPTVSDNKHRNKILYTATSRAVDYIFLIDNTGTFKNSISNTIDESKKNNENLLKNYEKEYGRIIDNDINVLNTGKKTDSQKQKDDGSPKPPSPKPNPPKTPPTKSKDDDAGKKPTSDDVPPVTQTPDNTPPFTSTPEDFEEEDEDDYPTIEDTTEDLPEDENSSYDEDEAVEGEFKNESENIHNLNNPQSLSEEHEGWLSRFNVRMPFRAGSTAYYVRMTDGNSNFIAILVPKNEKGKAKTFYQIGILDDEESQRLFGKPLSEILKGDTYTFRRGGGISGFDENSSQIISKGKVTGTQALTYIFEKTTQSGKNLIKNLVEKVSNVFSPRRGLKLTNIQIKILNPTELRENPRLKSGVPYLFLTYEGAKGGETIQHVRLSPRMMNKKKDSSLLSPLFFFRDTIKKLNKIFDDAGLPTYGAKEFNNLIKLFKKNFAVNSKGELVKKQNPGELITYEDAKAYMPSLDEGTFKKSIELFESLIPKLYGVADRDIKITPDEFDTFVSERKLRAIEGEIDGINGLFFSEKESRYYQYNDKTGKVRYYIEDNRNGDIKLKDDSFNGIKKLYVSGKQLVYGYGDTQKSLNAIAKNNASPNGVNIRILKKVNGRKGKLIYSTGVSLVRGEEALGSYVTALRGFVAEAIVNGNVLKNPYQPSIKGRSLEEQVEILEEELLKTNDFTREILDKIKEEKSSKPFTIGDLDKILEEENGEMASLRLPLSKKTINKLGKTLNEDIMALDDYIEHNLKSVVPTKVQVELDKKQSQSVPKKDTLSIDDDDDEDDLPPIGVYDHRDMLHSDEVKNPTYISKDQFIKEFRKRVGRVPNEHDMFLKDLMVKNPKTGSLERAYGTVITEDNEIYKRGYVFFDERDNGKYILEVAKHEAFHVVYNFKMNADQRNRLRKAFSSEFGSEFDTLSLADKEEFMAKKYQSYKKGDYAPKDNFIKKIFKYIIDFIKYVGTNGDYIESVFRDIENGKFRRSNAYPVGEDLHKVRRKFGSTANFKTATSNILQDLDYLHKNGYGKYAVPMNEMYDKSKKLLKRRMKVYYNNFYGLIAEYEKEIDESKKAQLEEKISKDAETIKILELTYRNYKAIFEVVIPSWKNKVEFESEELDQEEENVNAEGVNINDDIIDWEKVNMQTKVSGAVKSALSNISYKDSTGKTRWVNPKYAYLKTLEVISAIQPYSKNFIKQIDDLLDKEKDPAGRAVIEFVSDLYSDTKEMVVNGKKIDPTIRFFNGNHMLPGKEISNRYIFVRALDGTNLYKYNGIEAMKAAGVKIDIMVSSSTLFRTFSDEIIEKHNIPAERIKSSYIYAYNSNMLSELISNFSSQRKRDIKFIEKSGMGANSSFRYLVGSGRSVTSTTRLVVRESILNKINDSSQLKPFLEKITSAIKTSSSKAESDEELVLSMIKILGLNHLVSEFGVRRGERMSVAADKIRFLFQKSNIIENIMLRADEVFKEPDVEEGQEATDEDIKNLLIEKEAFIAKELMREAGTMINALGDVIDTDSMVKRVGSVTAADGKKKYIWVVSNNALDTIISILNKKRSNEFKGTTNRGSSNIELPEYLKNPFFRNNIFVSGINTLRGVDDYDGLRIPREGIDDDVIEYKDEKLRDYIARAFNGMFLNVINSSSKDDIQYAQGTFVISNKPVFNPIRMGVLKKESQRKAIRTMLGQFFLNDFSHLNVSTYNKYSMINLDNIAFAIIDVLGKDVMTPEIDPKNGAFKQFIISEDAYNKISNAIGIVNGENAAKKGDYLKAKKLIDDILDAVEKRINDRSTILAEKIINEKVTIPLNEMLTDKVLSLLDESERKKILKLNLVRRIDPKTKELIITNEKVKDGRIKTIESEEDVLNRVLEDEEAIKYLTDNDLESYSSLKTAADKLFDENGIDIHVERKMLITKEDVLPVIKLFYANDYINSHQLMQLVAGDFRFYKDPKDLTKRLSGAFAPGMLGAVHEKAMPRNTNAAIIEDVSFDKDDIMSFLKNNLGLSEETAKKISTYYGSDYEYSDGQGFITPERYEEIVSGYGETYGAGNVMKPAYFNIDADGAVRMLKYSTIVITDELAEKEPSLKILRDKMRSGGINGDIPIGEVIFKSGMKVGIPKSNYSVEDLLVEKNIPEDAIFAIDNTKYRLQLNPIHHSFDSVALPTQLIYFLNSTKDTQSEAEDVYRYIAAIVKLRFREEENALRTAEGVKDKIISKLKSGKNNEDTYEIIEELGSDKNILRPWDFPQIMGKSLLTLNSHIKSSVVKLRFDGTKAVLKTAFGTEEIVSIDNKTKRLAKTLQYNHVLVDEFNQGDVMYAEAIFPQGLLPKEIEEKMMKEIEENGIADMEFLTPDALGFRLPSSELHSAVPLRVKGFYDSKGTNVIIAPEEIVALHGSDYDVDSLFIIIREYPKEKGERKGIPYGYYRDRESGKLIFDYSPFDLFNPESDVIKNLRELTEEEEKNAFAVFVVHKTKDGYISTTRAADKGEEGKIGLPGGKVDKGESIFDAAKRESAEEGWNVKLSNKIIASKIVDGKPVVWVEAISAEKRDDWKEKHRGINPITASAGELSSSGYGNEFIGYLDFINLPTDVKIKYYKNAIVDTILNIVSSKELRERMAMPIQMKVIKDDIKIINDARSIAQKKYYDLSDLLNRQKIHASSYEATTGVGVWANGIKVISYLQTAIPDPDNAISEENALIINSKKFVKWNDSKEMYEELDAFLNTTIDNVKEQDLVELNMTSSNIKAYIAMRATGVNMKTANRIFAQNVIDYANNSSERTALKDITKILKNRTSEAIITKRDLSTRALMRGLSHPRTVNEIITDFNNKKPISDSDIEFLIVQRKVLVEFSAAMKIGKELSDISKILNLVKETPVLNNEVEEVLALFEKRFEKRGEGAYRYKEEENFIINTKDLLVALPHLKEIVGVLEFEREIRNNNFILYNEVLTDGLERIKNTFSISKNDVDSEGISELQSNFMNFIVGTVNFDPEFNGYEREHQVIDKKSGKVLIGQEAFKQRMVQTVEALKKDPRFKQNLFIQALEIRRNRAGVKTISFTMGSNMDYGDIIDFQNAFDELLLYKVKNGSVVREDFLPDINWDIASEEEKLKFKQKKAETLGFSMLQKDLFRYLILETGLRYSPTSYISVIPIRLKHAFMRSYESFLFDKANGIINNKNALENVIDLFMPQFALNNPDAVSIRKVKGEAIENKNAHELAKYVFQDTIEVRDGKVWVYGDLAFPPKRKKDTGEIDQRATRRAYPEYIRTYGIEKKNGFRSVTIYKRVILSDEAIVYQKVGTNNLVPTYSSIKPGKAITYNKDKVFNPFIRHVKVASLQSDRIESYTNMSWEIIMISEYNDPARVNTRLVKIKSVNVNPDGKYRYIVENEKNTNIPIPSYRSSEETFFGKDLGKFRLADGKKLGNAYKVLKYIAEREESLSWQSKALMRFRNTKHTSIINKKIRDRDTLGVTRYRLAQGKRNSFYTDTYVDFAKIGRFIDIGRGTFYTYSETIVHEEIHRYTSFLLGSRNLLEKESMNNTEFGKSIKNVDLFMRDLGFSDDEILFSARVTDLFNQWKRSDLYKDSKFKGVIKRADEFITYGLTNKEFIEEIKSIKADKNKSIFEKLVDFIIQLFKTNDESVHDYLAASFEAFTRGDINATNEYSAFIPDVKFNEDIIKKWFNSIFMSGGLKTKNDIAILSAIDSVFKEAPEYIDVVNQLKSIEENISLKENNKFPLPECKSCSVNLLNSLDEKEKVLKKQLTALTINMEVASITSRLFSLSKEGKYLNKEAGDFLSSIILARNELLAEINNRIKNGDTHLIEYRNAINNNLGMVISYVYGDISINSIASNTNSIEYPSKTIKDIVDSGLKSLIGSDEIVKIMDTVPQRAMNVEGVVSDSISEEDLQEETFKCGM